jgi:DeoR/GlpR family transcriptional regulator of sugar metabolism
MLSSERKERIFEELSRDRRVRASELAARFGVSEDTIRRDLRALADEGRIRRVYGGAVPLTPVAATYTGRTRESVDAKSTIARAAMAYLKPGQTVFFDAGTTAVTIAAQLPPDLRLTVVTHSLPVASALVEKPLVEVVVLGGRLLHESAAMVGAEVVNGYGRCRADLCVLGTASVHPEVGLGVFHHDDAEAKRAMVNAAAEVMLVAAGEKFGTAAPFLIGPLSILDRIVTDRLPAGEVADAIARAQIEVVAGGGA